MEDKILYVTISYFGNQYSINHAMKVFKDGTTITSGKSGYGDILDPNHTSHNEIIGYPVIDFRSCSNEGLSNIISAPDNVRPSEQGKYYSGSVETWIRFCMDNGATIHQIG